MKQETITFQPQGIPVTGEHWEPWLIMAELDRAAMAVAAAFVRAEAGRIDRELCEIACGIQ